MFNRFSDKYLSDKNGDSASVFMKDWFLLDLLKLLTLIPAVGAIAYLIICIILATKEEIAEPIKNRIRLNLIYAVAGTVITIILIIVFGSTIAGVIAAMGGPEAFAGASMT